MPNEPTSKGTIEISTALIGATGAIIAALIGGVCLLISTGVLQVNLSSKDAGKIQPPVPANPTALPVQSTISIVQQQPTAIDCIHPRELAKQKGWSDMGWADEKYGGLRVGLSKPDQLPLLWEAIGGGRRISQNDTDRQMAASVWSIYPPYACRAQFGFSW